MVPDDDDRLVFLDEAPDSDSPRPAVVPWTVLIVDDDEEVHSVTRLALESFTFRDRPLRFLDAHSAAEAKSILEVTADVAVILLDVVMETDDAGLRVVQYLRETLDNKTTRIILRTGQPGQAPEHDLIVRHDINDYKSKTELTLSKLYTMMVSSLRSYEQIRALETHRLASHRLLGAVADACREREREGIASDLLNRVVASLDGAIDGLLCLDGGSGLGPVLLRWGSLAADRGGPTPEEEAQLRALSAAPPGEAAQPLSPAPGLTLAKGAIGGQGPVVSLLLRHDPGQPPSDGDFPTLGLFLETLLPTKEPEAVQ